MRVKESLLANMFAPTEVQFREIGPIHTLMRCKIHALLYKEITDTDDADQQERNELPSVPVLGVQ
jgi:hypothetical protein